jgi:hypothetical protein
MYFEISQNFILSIKHFWIFWHLYKIYISICASYQRTILLFATSQNVLSFFYAITIMCFSPCSTTAAKKEPYSMIKSIQFSLINYDCLSFQYKIIFPNVISLQKCCHSQIGLLLPPTNRRPFGPSVARCGTQCPPWSVLCKVVTTTIWNIWSNCWSKQLFDCKMDP